MLRVICVVLALGVCSTAQAQTCDYSELVGDWTVTENDPGVPGNHIALREVIEIDYSDSEYSIDISGGWKVEANSVSHRCDEEDEGTAVLNALIKHGNCRHSINVYRDKSHTTGERIKVEYLSHFGYCKDHHTLGEGEIHPGHSHADK